MYDIYYRITENINIYSDSLYMYLTDVVIHDLNVISNIVSQNIDVTSLVKECVSGCIDLPMTEENLIIVCCTLIEHMIYDNSYMTDRDNVNLLLEEVLIHNTDTDDDGNYDYLYYRMVEYILQFLKTYKLYSNGDTEYVNVPLKWLTHDNRYILSVINIRVE